MKIQHDQQQSNGDTGALDLGEAVWEASFAVALAAGMPPECIEDLIEPPPDQYFANLCGALRVQDPRLTAFTDEQIH